MLAACLPLHSSRRLVRAPVPVQLSPLAPPGELLRAESVTSMRQQLSAQGVDVSCWGVDTNRDIAELWSEVQNGEAELRLDSSGRVCRCLSVVKVCVRRPEAPHEHLIEALQIFPDGRRRKRGMMLSETLLRHETPLEGASRGLIEELGTLASAARLANSSLRSWQACGPPTLSLSPSRTSRAWTPALSLPTDPSPNSTPNP